MDIADRWSHDSLRQRRYRFIDFRMPRFSNSCDNYRIEKKRIDPYADTYSLRQTRFLSTRGY